MRASRVCEVFDTNIHVQGTLHYITTGSNYTCSIHVCVWKMIGVAFEHEVRAVINIILVVFFLEQDATIYMLSL